MQFLCAAIAVLYYSAILNHDPVPNDSNELCVISHITQLLQQKPLFTTYRFPPNKISSRRWELLCR